MTNYLIKIQEDTFSLTEEELDSLDIIPTGDSQYHALSNLKSYDIKVIQSNFPNKEITL